MADSKQASKQGAKKSSSSRRSSSKKPEVQKSDGSRAQAVQKELGEAYGEPVRYGLETGTRADNVLPERNAPSRDTQTVTPLGPAVRRNSPGFDVAEGGAYDE